MKKSKILKITLVIIGTILVLIIGLFAIDYFRLRNTTDYNVRPIITFRETKTDTTMKYNSLGYTIYYNLGSDKKTIESVRFEIFNIIFTEYSELEKDKEDDVENQDVDDNTLESINWNYVTENGITDEMAFLEDITEESFNAIGTNLQSLVDEIAEKEREDPNFIIEGKWFDYFKNDERYHNVLDMKGKALKPLYFIIYKSENQSLYEYICSFAMYDILDLQNSDNDFYWATSKEFLTGLTNIILEIDN